MWVPRLNQHLFSCSWIFSSNSSFNVPICYGGCEYDIYIYSAYEYYLSNSFETFCSWIAMKWLEQWQFRLSQSRMELSVERLCNLCTMMWFSFHCLLIWAIIYSTIGKILWAPTDIMWGRLMHGTLLCMFWATSISHCRASSKQSSNSNEINIVLGMFNHFKLDWIIDDCACFCESCSCMTCSWWMSAIAISILVHFPMHTRWMFARHAFIVDFCIFLHQHRYFAGSATREKNGSFDISTMHSAHWRSHMREHEFSNCKKNKTYYFQLWPVPNKFYISAMWSTLTHHARSVRTSNMLAWNLSHIICSNVLLKNKIK